MQSSSKRLSTSSSAGCQGALVVLWRDQISDLHMEGFRSGSHLDMLA